MAPVWEQEKTGRTNKKQCHASIRARPKNCFYSHLKRNNFKECFVRCFFVFLYIRRVTFFLSRRARVTVIHFTFTALHFTFTHRSDTIIEPKVNSPSIESQFFFSRQDGEYGVACVSLCVSLCVCVSVRRYIDNSTVSRGTAIFPKGFIVVPQWYFIFLMPSYYDDVLFP